MRAHEDDSVAEFTFKAVFTGVVLGIVFGAANAYLGLRVGMTVSASIPAAVMTVALFRLFRVRGTILEANLSQTVGSASTSLATGTIFTIPALYMWGVAPPFWQIAVLALLGGVLGLAAMIPLRRLLIVREHATLPYPEGTACAEVLKATTGGASGARWIFFGMAVGAAVELALKAAFLMPGEIGADVLPTLLPKAHVAIEIAPALIGVGFILGFRQAGVCVAGGVISALVLVPLFATIGAGLGTPVAPETVKTIAQMSAEEIRKQYARYVGAGAVAMAGILTVVRNFPAMAQAFGGVVRGVRSGGGGSGTGERTDRDLPGVFTVGGIAAVVLTAVFVPGVLAGELDFVQRIVCGCVIAVLGVLFVTVAARIVGIVGVSSQPTSGIALMTLIVITSIFAAQGWTGAGSAAAVLTVGTIVTIAASKAGDISQDLKTGFLVGATPARQQFGQLIGAACACWTVAATIQLLGQEYTFGSKALAAPQATLMKTIVEGVLTGNLPWNFVLAGAGLAIGAMLCGVSGLAFAIGVYLPLATMAPLFVGGCVRALYEKARGDEKATEGMEPGVLAASGLVAGQALTGVLVAGLVGAGALPKERDPVFGAGVGTWLAILVVLAVCTFLYASRKKAT